MPLTISRRNVPSLSTKYAIVKHAGNSAMSSKLQIGRWRLAHRHWAAGVRVAVVDVTSADVATGPFRVARAVSPDLQPILYGYGLERIPVERIRRMKSSAVVPPINPIW